ncbi:MULTISPECIES: ATP-binding protein [Streptomyces]|uniref:ATP-binding protein n=2 Tax=Streptomyces TaxID=1883 RepID=A0ABV9INY3_9ACTN
MLPNSFRGYRKYSIDHLAAPVGGRAPRCPDPGRGEATPWRRRRTRRCVPLNGSCPPPGHPKTYDRFDAVSYTPYPRSVTLARRRVAQLAADWGHPHAAGDAALIASELCTNALLHGCLRNRLFRVETSLSGTALRIAVTDPRGERLPDPRPADRDDQFGRGLLIVDTLAARWATERLTVGKTIWAELDIPRGAHA